MAWRSDLPRPLALLAPGGGWGCQALAPPHTSANSPSTCARSASHVVVNAAQSDSPDALAVVAASDGSAQINVGNVAQLIALMRRTDLFIGGDSGPTHLAAALAVPTVALFGPTDPARNGPWGPGPVVVLRNPASADQLQTLSATRPPVCQ